MPTIALQTIIKADKKIVFDLSRSIDLHKISTAHTKEEAIAGKTSGLIELEEQVTWRAKHLGVFQTLTSKITAYQSPDYFVDEMVRGVFKRFRHEHHFSTVGSDTLLTDYFDYTAPFGILGVCMDIIFLQKYMTTLLIKRNQYIKTFAESDQWKAILNPYQKPK
ncbi:cell division protein [Aquimarina hainanensis]|uniref:Cell division protein n=1 Tax=Aquimarina hainanensis TaxID=1578017 RepID=A0ABW5NDZ6_9FLAO